MAPQPKPKRAHRIVQKLLLAAIPFILVALFLYSLSQLLHGERGVGTWLKLREQVQTLQQTQHHLLQQKQTQDQHVQRLLPPYDRDYLDEVLRQQLPLAHPQDYILYVTPLSNSLP